MRTVDLTLRILEEVALRQPIGVSDLARALDLPKTTTHRALMTLAKASWLEVVDNGRPLWSLSIRALTVGSLALNARGRLRAVAIPAMEELRRATEETIHLNVYYQTNTVLVERLDGIRPIRVFNALGGTVTWHPTAAGRMMLSLLRQDSLDAYFTTSVPHDHILSPEEADALRAKLPAYRSQGYATTLGGLFHDVNAVAAPIFEAPGLPIAAVSVSAPADRMPEDLAMQYGERVAETARRISLGLQI